jgi:ferrous iron transport protein B
MDSKLSGKRLIAVVGNPNCGKTTIFNELTGLRQKVGNYPGVTVEKKEGIITFADGCEITLLDLPGTYSLSANSPDEKITTDVILGKLPGVPRPDGVLCVLDASNPGRNLYLVSQIIDQRIPVIIALNMTDVAERQGIHVDAAKLSSLLGVPVVPTIGSRRSGIAMLKAGLYGSLAVSPAVRKWTLPEPVGEEHDELTALLVEAKQIGREVASHEAANLLSTPVPLNNFRNEFPQTILDHVQQDYRRFNDCGVDRFSVFVQSRYQWIHTVCDQAVTTGERKARFSDRIDSVLTHRVWGYLIFFTVMVVMFQSIFTWATVPMRWIGDIFSWTGSEVESLLPPGDLRDLIIHGVISGVGAVVTFLPQILLLFLFIGILEDTGYMARAAFIMDRLMNRVGLHGKSFIPIISSFACAIPGIMSARTIENPRDRLVTILVAPFASCSARLPVYSLLIGAFIPATLIFGFWNLQGMVMIGLYLLGIIAALLTALLFKRTILRGKTPDFIMELPPYRLPSLKSILLQMRERSAIFLKKAGTIILGVSIVLWFLAAFPKTEGAPPAVKLEHSYVGQAGRFIEPLIRPLGFDWKIGVGILTSLLQREVFVSTVSTIYSMDAGAGEGTSVREAFERDRNPVTGRPVFTTLTAICVMIYYVLAMQCMSTVAVVRRETNSWKWPLIQTGYMTLVAYAFTFAVYRFGLYILGA